MYVPVSAIAWHAHESFYRHISQFWVLQESQWRTLVLLVSSQRFVSLDRIILEGLFDHKASVALKCRQKRVF